MPEHTRGTFSIERGLEYADQTSTSPRMFAPAQATQPREEENPLTQRRRDYGPLGDEDASGDGDGRRCEHVPHCAVLAS